jgi:hypothetical protein
MFLLPAALLLKVPLTVGDVLFRNIIPVLVGNAIAGALVVAGSYSYQFGKLGEKSRNAFIAKLKEYETRKKQEKLAKQMASTMVSWATREKVRRHTDKTWESVLSLTEPVNGKSATERVNGNSAAERKLQLHGSYSGLL